MVSAYEAYRRRSAFMQWYIFYMEGIKTMTKKCLVSIAIILVSLFSVFTAGAQTDEKTPKESEVIGYLQQGLVVFLCFHDVAESNLDKIKADIGSVAANFKGAIETVYVSGDDKKEDNFREKLKVLPNETAVFIITPQGNAVAKLAGTDITKTNLMKALVSSCGGGGCGSGSGSGSGSGCGPR
jgi:hypothetical protein